MKYAIFFIYLMGIDIHTDIQNPIPNNNNPYECECNTLMRIEQLFMEYFEAKNIKITGDELFHVRADRSNNVKLIWNKKNNPIKDEDISNLEKLFSNIDYSCYFIFKWMDNKPNVTLRYKKSIIDDFKCR